MKTIITRFDKGLHLSRCSPKICQYLQHVHRGMEFSQQSYQMEKVYNTRLLHIPDGKGGVYTLRGFYQKIIKILDKQCEPYEVVDMRTHLPPIDWAAVKNVGLRDYQIKPVVNAIAAIQQNDGIFKATGGFGKSVMMMAFYAAYSNLNTIVAVPLKQVFRQLVEKFRLYFPDKKIGMVGDGACIQSDHITIATYASLGRCSTEKCQLLLMDEIQSATGDKVQSVITAMAPIRIVGFTATPSGTFSNSDKLIKGLFGELIADIDYEEAQSQNAVVPCSVYMVEIPEDPMNYYGTKIKSIITKGIEKYNYRNKLIGDICKAVPNKWQTLVHVDHITHIQALMSFMPEDSKFVHRNSDMNELKEYGLTAKNQDLIIEDFEKNNFQFLVATDMLRAGADIPNIRVVIQGAGGGSKIEVLQEAYRGSRTLSGEKRKELGVDPKTHFVLIDFIDKHDDFLKTMSDKRMEIYKKEGWDIKTIKQISEIEWMKSSSS